MIVRKARIEDAISVAAVAIAVWIDAYADNGMDQVYSRYVLERFAEENVTKLICSKHVYVAETDFGICGFAVVSAEVDGQYEIETMYILARFHSKGIGAKILGCIFQYLSGQFWLKCAEYNPRALTFYRRNGFVDTGAVNFTLDGKDYPCIILTKSDNNLAASVRLE